MWCRCALAGWWLRGPDPRVAARDLWSMRCAIALHRQCQVVRTGAACAACYGQALDHGRSAWLGLACHGQTCTAASACAGTDSRHGPEEVAQLYRSLGQLICLPPKQDTCAAASTHTSHASLSCPLAPPSMHAWRRAKPAHPHCAKAVQVQRREDTGVCHATAKKPGVGIDQCALHLVLHPQHRRLPFQACTDPDLDGLLCQPGEV